MTSQSEKRKFSVETVCVRVRNRARLIVLSLDMHQTRVIDELSPVTEDVGGNDERGDDPQENVSKLLANALCRQKSDNEKQRKKEVEREEDDRATTLLWRGKRRGQDRRRREISQKQID